jgi:hypothetical protein
MRLLLKGKIGYSYDKMNHESGYFLAGKGVRRPIITGRDGWRGGKISPTFTSAVIGVGW